MEHEHTRFERLAVGHVLGGLDEVEAATFRSHLLGCRECRLRVSELRGIASDLAAAERDERATALRVATEMARTQQEAPPQAPPVAGWRAWPWAILTAAAVVSVLVGVLFWNLALRERTSSVLAAAQRQEAVLEVLAEGTTLDHTAETGVTGPVALDSTTLALDLAGVPTPAADEAIVVLQLDGDGDELARSDAYTRSAGQLGEGRFVVALPRAVGVARVEVRSVTAPLSDRAVDAGTPVLTADVPPGG